MRVHALKALVGTLAVALLAACRTAPVATTVAGPADPDVERVEEELRRSLGTKVRLTKTRRGGRITIEYYGDEELARLYVRLTAAPA